MLIKMLRVSTSEVLVSFMVDVSTAELTEDIDRQPDANLKSKVVLQSLSKRLLTTFRKSENESII